MAKEVLEIYINGSELLVLTGCPDQALKDDMLASALYTQLAADHQFSKFDDFPKWQDILSAASSKFGWLRLDTASVQEQVATPGALKPADVLGALLPTSLAHWRGDALQSLFTQLCSTPSNADAFRLLKQGMLGDTSSGDGCPVVMRLSIVGPKGERVSLCLAFDTREPLDENPFNQCFSRPQLRGNITCSRVISQFDQVRYSLLRNPVNKALQIKQSSLLLPITTVDL